MRDDQRNYIIVGAFVLAMLAGLIWWLTKLSGRTGASDPYTIEFANVGALSEGIEILYEGYPVGLIDEITPIDEGGRQRFRVDVDVQRGWRIPEDSVASIYSAGLLSASVIQIHAGESDTALEPGSQIPSVEAVSVLDVVNDLAENSVKPLVDGLAESIPEILGQLDTFTEQLNVTLERVQEVLKPGNTQRLEQILVRLEQTSDNVASFTGDLRETQRRLDELLVQVGGMLDGEEGSVGQAATDLQYSLESVARHIESINANLEATTRNMNEFSRQVRENPSVILRGRETAEDGGAP